MGQFLSLLRLIPVAPASWGWHTRQARGLAYCRPGQWCQRLCGIKTNWHRERWLVKPAQPMEYGPLRDAVIASLKRCDGLERQETSNSMEQIYKANFVTQPQTSPDKLEIFFFTEQLRWLDVMEISFGAASSSDGGLWVDLYSFSAAVSPASGFLALPISILLFFIVFSDIGQNRIHCRTLRKLIEDEGLAVEVRAKAEDEARLVLS